MPQAIPMVLMAAGTAVSAYGQLQQGRDMRRQAEGQARVHQADSLQGAYDARQNEAVARHHEKSQLYEATESIRRIRREGREQKAGVTASLARRGLDLGSTSLEGILGSVRQTAESEAAGRLWSASQGGQESRMQARGFSLSADRTFALGTVRAAHMRRSGRDAQRSATIGAFGTALSGAAQTWSMRPGD